MKVLVIQFCPAAGTHIFLCIYSTSHNKAGLTKQCTLLLMLFILKPSLKPGLGLGL